MRPPWIDSIRAETRRRHRAPSVLRRRRGRWCSRIAAAARSRPKTRWPRSTTAWRSAPTASSSTSTCRATASSSCITTATLDARRRCAAPIAARHARTSCARARTCPTLGRRARALSATRAIIIEMKVEPPRAGARPSSTWSARADAVDRVCLGSFGRRVLRAARALEPAIATSAAREEVRWALYRRGAAGRCRASPYARLSGAGDRRPHARRVAALRRRRAPRRPRRAGVDRGHRSRRAPPARLGRRRADHRSARYHRAAGRANVSHARTRAAAAYRIERCMPPTLHDIYAARDARLSASSARRR